MRTQESLLHKLMSSSRTFSAIIQAPRGCGSSILSFHSEVVSKLCCTGMAMEECDLYSTEQDKLRSAIANAVKT